MLMAERARLDGLLSPAAAARVIRETTLGACPSTRDGDDRLGCRASRPRQRHERIARAEHVRARIMPSGGTLSGRRLSGSEAPQSQWDGGDAAADPSLAVIEVRWDGTLPPVVSHAVVTDGTTRRAAAGLARLQADQSQPVPSQARS
jgi:hypothetical protein